MDQQQWIIDIAAGDPIPSNARVCRILSIEERPVYGSTASKRHYVLLVESRTHETRHTTAMPMDQYEAANLQAGLETLRKLGLDTGDWLGQLLFKLQKYEITQRPNQTVEQQVERAVQRLALQGLDVS
jgi:hypothetical protein